METHPEAVELNVPHNRTFTASKGLAELRLRKMITKGLNTVGDR